MRGKIAFLILLLFSLGLLTGCFSKNDLRPLIDKELDSRFGITEYEILSATNNWFEGGLHNAVIEIKQPYVTRSSLNLNVSDLEKIIYENRVLEDLLKGAYVAQFPEVITKIQRIIEKNDFMSEPPEFENEKKETFHYYLQFYLNEQQKSALENELKKEKKWDLTTLLPTLRPPASDDGIGLESSGVVNLTFEYNSAKSKKVKSLPKAEEIAAELKESGLLPPCKYNLVVRTVFFDDTTISYSDESNNSDIQFEITEPLTQAVEHTNYRLRVPQSWKLSSDSEDNPTRYFEVEGKQVGGLFLARYDRLEDLPADRKELTELRSDTYQVYSYSTKFDVGDGSRDADVICIYVPAKNSGYELVFVRDEVSESLAFEIASTMEVK